MKWILVRAALQSLDLDGEWDAMTHDQQMAAILVETDGAAASGDDEKPTWDDDINVDDIIPQSEDDARHTSASLRANERKKAKKKERKKARNFDADGVDMDEMDADAIQDGEKEWDEVEWDGTEEMRKRVFDQYMEEVYELEFNDMVRLPSLLLRTHSRPAQVAGMPTRFRYTPVAQSAYGLNPTEILLADDKDLNELIGLKKLAPYRKPRDAWDAKRGERLREFKKKFSVQASDVGANVNEGEHLDNGKSKAKKRRGRKERMREKEAQEPLAVEADAVPVTDEGATDEPVKRKRRRLKRSSQPVEQLVE